jgi:hypothetical protein
MAGFRCILIGVCLAIAMAVAPASAGVRVVGTGPRPPAAHGKGGEVGFYGSASIPTGDDWQDVDEGVNAGFTATRMYSNGVGFGLDLGYAGWRSAAAGAELDQLFSALSQSQIQGTMATLESYEAMAHLKVAPCTVGHFTPWFQIGVGAARVNQKLELPVAQMEAAGFQFRRPYDPNEIHYEPVFVGKVGVDVATEQAFRLGLDASYRLLALYGDSSAFSSFAVGGHLLFGRW